MFLRIPDERIIDFERSHPVLDGLFDVRTGTEYLGLEFVPREGTIYKQWDHDEQRLDFFPDSSDVLLLLPQNGIRIFHECWPTSRQLTPENRRQQSVEIEDFGALRPIRCFMAY